MQPGQLVGVALAALLVEPVRGDPELGGLVHVEGADLDLEGLAARADHRGVQRLVEVELGHRDVVLEAPRDGLPDGVDDAHGAVAVLDGVDEDAQAGEVEDLVELLAAAAHLRVDGVEVLDAAGDVGADAGLLELGAQKAGRLVHVVLAIDAPLRHPLLDLLVLARVQRGEGEVLELPLHVVDAQAVREGRVDLQRLLGLLDLLLLAEIAERVHVVQTVAELDEDDADVGRHRDDHLAVVLGLLLLLGGEMHLGELGDPVDQHGDLFAELVLDPGERRARVFDDVVQQRRGHGDRVELELGGVEGGTHRVVDVPLAALAALPAVEDAGGDERPGDELTVGVRVVPGDGREEVVEERAVLVGDLRQIPAVRQVRRKSLV